jgi:hypothetical protein
VRGESEHILVAMDAGTYNVQKAICGPYCLTCQGAVDEWVDVDPFAVAVGGHTQQKFTVQYHTGSQYDLTAASTWSSSNHNVGTVSAGLVTGVGAGSLTVSASDDNTPDYAHVCYLSNPDNYCPMGEGVQGGAPGDVCDFSIKPATVYAQDCTGKTQNSNGFNTTITPAGGYCLSDSVKSSCSESITSGSQIDFVVGSPKCVFNLGNPSATVTYLAGPKLPNGTAGSINMTFDLVFNQTSVSHTGTATVQCP